MAKKRIFSRRILTPENTLEDVLSPGSITGNNKPPTNNSRLQPELCKAH